MAYGKQKDTQDSHIFQVKFHTSPKLNFRMDVRMNGQNKTWNYKYFLYTNSFKAGKYLDQIPCFFRLCRNYLWIENVDTKSK